MDIARNGSDIANVSAFLKNLGLGDGSALPVGVPVPWPVATAPSGWLRCNGATFSASDYPQLAKAYPSLRLPDLRGSLSGAGMTDAGLTRPARCLSAQEATVVGGYDDNESGDFSAISSPNYAFSDPLTGGQLAMIQGKTWINKASSAMDSYNWYAIASTSRPRNVAFNYIVRGSIMSQQNSEALSADGLAVAPVTVNVF